MALRAAAKALVEAVIGRDIRRIEPGSIALIPQRQRHQAWFCHALQLQWLLDTHRVDLVIDVGANEGQFAQRLRHVYSGEIISFEPLSEPFGRLAQAARTDPRWRVHQCALGSEEATGTIHVASDSAFSSFLVANEFSQQHFRRSGTLSEELVRVKRLDDVLAPVLTGTAPRRLFLKLDTQGYDLEVFKGLGKYADQMMMMQSEVSLVPIYEQMPHWTESIATYENAGLYVAGMFPVTRDDATGRVIEYDCLMVRGHEQASAR
jgi:FkbM family methyltransferase